MGKLMYSDEDAYFSDEELRAAYKNPKAHVYYQKGNRYTITYDDEPDDGVQFQPDPIDTWILVDIYHALQESCEKQGLALLDRANMANFEVLIRKNFS